MGAWSLNRMMMGAAGVAGGLLVAIGAFETAGQLSEISEARGWPSTEGRIEASEVAVRSEQRVRSTRHHYSPRVRYRYTVNGQSFVGDRIWLSGERELDAVEAGRVVRSYPVGSAVQVFYAPDDPGRATLRAAVDPLPLIMWFAFGCGFLGLGAWFRTRVRREAISPTPPPPFA